MKPITILLQRATLTMLALCCSIITFAQITVTPPSGSYVYLAGTGGTLGSIVFPFSTGDVGEEGIVGMPLANANSLYQGSFTVNFTSGSQSVIGWSVEGDLTIVSGATSTTVVIANYNENPRSPATDKAQSKGRVTLEYLDTDIPIGCPGQNRYFTFDIYKTYNSTTTVSSVNPIPPIIGPGCVGPNQQVTYSVDPIASDNLADEIGVDRYFWTVTGDHTVDYYSTDSSSITFTTGAGFTGGSVTCCFGLCNYYTPGLTTTTGGSNFCADFDISPTPDDPVITLSQNCLDIGATTTITASVTAQTGYTYTWSMPSNPSWNLSVSGPPGNAVTITPNASDDNPGILILTTNGCQNRVDYDTIGRNLIAPLSLVGNATCVTPGSNVNISLSSGSQNNTCWRMPTGWANPTNIYPTGSSVNVLVPATAGPGAYVIKAFSCDCRNDTLTYTINVKPSSVSISSNPSPACFTPSGSAVEFTAVLTPSATTGVYTWGTLSGWSGSSTSNILNYTPGASAASGNMTLTVCATTGVCCVTATPVPVSQGLTINSITPSQTCVNIGVADVINLTASVSGPSPTYSWAVPAGLGTAVSTTTNPVVINTPATVVPGIYQVTLTASNLCGNEVETIDIEVDDPNNLQMSHTPVSGFGDFYAVTAGLPAGTTYAWFYTRTSSGTTPIALPGTTSTYAFTQSNFADLSSVCCDVTVTGGCTVRVCAPTIGSYTPKLVPGMTALEPINTQGLERMQIHPNPNSGAFTITVPQFDKQAVVSVHNAAGELVLQLELKPGENTFDEKQLAAGVYILIFNTDGKIQAERIVITK